MFDSPPLPTNEEMSQLFWLIFESLNGDVQQEIRAWWKKMGSDAPQIETNPEHFQSEVVYVSSVGSLIQFRVDRLADRKHSVLRVIYHELAHCYLAAVGGHSLADYNKRRDHHESGATKLTKRFSDDLKRAPFQRKNLRANELIERLSTLYDFSPLYIGDKGYAQRIAGVLSASAGK